MTTSPNFLTERGRREVKHLMVLAGIPDAKVLATLTGIPYGSLRNWIGGFDPIRLERVYDVSRLLLTKTRDHVSDDDIRKFSDAILGTNDGVPDEPPKQPSREPKGPARRQDTEPTKGPRRTRNAA